MPNVLLYKVNNTGNENVFMPVELNFYNNYINYTQTVIIIIMLNYSINDKNYAYNYMKWLEVEVPV